MKRQGMSGWLWLLVAGAFEIGMTTALKLEQQDSRFLWVFLVCAVAGFECLAKAIKTIPLGLAYAIWTGIGAVGTAILGIYLFDESRDVLRFVCIGLIVAGIVGLKLVTPDSH